ncbi:MAG: Uncharacterized protein FD135_2025 [Comamonadaceae bacterium]|nr:MAG: Uncharacterized protein FD135_2025 [Comamonadaceae bacterium]
MEKVAQPGPVLLSISVVSHGQMDLITSLMQDIQNECRDIQLELILTLNLAEFLTFELTDYTFPIRVIKNLEPKGFGANHNQAFKQSKGQYFCVMNPDIRFSSNPFPELLMSFKKSHTGVVAPMVLGITGEPEDSFRRFPTPWSILKKAMGRHPTSEYVIAAKELEPEWVGGMFMLFHKQVFELMHGFDERYFLYYEDVDLCARLQLAGYRVVLNANSQVVHHARRTSHRSVKYLRWHLSSMLRFFLSPGYQQLKHRPCP